MKKSIFIIVLALFSLSIPIECYGQIKAIEKIAKVASKLKNVSKVGAKTSKAAKTASKVNRTNPTGRVIYATSRAANAYKQVPCPTCHGTGCFYYGGQQYTCKTCNGKGTVLRRR